MTVDTFETEAKKWIEETRTTAGSVHDDAGRGNAYGPADGLPDTKVCTFTQDLFDEAKKDGWVVISMKNDWKKIFAFETINEGGSDE